MRGCIVYERSTAAKRKEYIALYRQHFEKRGIPFELVFTDNYREELTKTPVDFAIVRAIVPEISKELEETRIAVYNNARVSEICNDKWLTFQYNSEHTDIPFMT